MKKEQNLQEPQEQALNIPVVRQRNICKNCWYYHKNIKQCRLNRNTEMGNVGMTVSKNDTCEHFIR